MTSGRQVPGNEGPSRLTSFPGCSWKSDPSALDPKRWVLIAEHGSPHPRPRTSRGRGRGSGVELCRDSDLGRCTGPWRGDGLLSGCSSAPLSCATLSQSHLLSGPPSPRLSKKELCRVTSKAPRCLLLRTAHTPRRHPSFLSAPRWCASPTAG